MWAHTLLEGLGICTLIVICLQYLFALRETLQELYTLLLCAITGSLQFTIFTRFSILKKCRSVLMSLDVHGSPQFIQALQFRSRNTFATLITNHLPLNFLVTNARLYKMVASIENLAEQINKMAPKRIRSISARMDLGCTSM